MNTEDRLRQLSKIEPRAEQAGLFRAQLVMSARPQLPSFTMRAFLTGVLQSGSAMAMTGLLLLITISGFSVWKLLSPLAGLDTASLRAEAQAIDIQIHLADLQYQEGVSSRQMLVAPNSSFHSATPVAGLKESTPAEVVNSTSTDSEDNATSTYISVNQVLDILSE